MTNSIFLWLLIYTGGVSAIGMIVYQSSRKGNTFQQKENVKNINLFFALATFLMLFIIVVFRSAYNDTYAYFYKFEYYKPGWDSIKEVLDGNRKGKGFNVVQILFKTYISKDITVWFFALALFQMGAIIRLFYKYSCNYFFTSYLFITSGSFTWLMSGTRQYLAVCLVLYFFDYLLERKAIRFLIVVLLAATIHIAALLWIPVYFICNSEPLSVRMIGFALGIILVLMFMDVFTGFLDSALEDTAYEGFSESIKGQTTLNPIRAMVSAVPWLLALFKRKQLKAKGNVLMNTCVNLAFISTAIYIVAVFSSGTVIGRLPEFFTPLNHVLMPWVLDKLYDDEKATDKLIKYFCYILYFGYFYYDQFIGNSAFDVYKSEKLGINVK